jgi:hypothetical protein
MAKNDNHQASHPDAPILWRSRNPDVDSDMADALQRAAKSQASVSIPGLVGRWIISKIDVVDGETIVWGVPAPEQ